MSAIYSTIPYVKQPAADPDMNSRLLPIAPKFLRWFDFINIKGVTNFMWILIVKGPIYS